MNLLFLDSVDCRTFGGYENWILLVASYFAERGHKVTTVGRPGAEYLRRMAARSGETEILELPISGDFNPLTLLRLKKILSDRRVDLMTVNFNKDVRLGGMAARWYGPARVCWRIGLDITSNGWAHRFLTPRLVDGVIVPSQALKQQIMRHGYLSDDKVTVIYNGTQDKTFLRPDPQAAATLREKYHLAGDDIVAVTVGRFVDQKGHVYLVDAAPEIVRQTPRLRFLWLGDGQLESTLRTRINQLGLEKHFIFAGMLDNIDLELAGSDLMIHPAVEEPFSHAVLEAMRAGLPIVASRVGGVPEALTDGVNALLVAPREPRILSTAVVKLLRSPELRDAYGKAAQARWREDFRIDKMMLKVEAYFESLVRGRAAA